MFAALSELPAPVVQALSFFAALFPLVLVHELGHFLLAKLNHVRVDEFGIGFPPRLLRLWNDGETDYTVNLLPLGGFVRLSGEDDPDIPGAFAGRGKAARAAILVAGPLANFLLAALILIGLALAGPVSVLLPSVRGVTVAAVEAGSPAQAAGLLVGDVVVATDGRLLSDREPGPVQSGATPEMEALTADTDAATGRPLELTVLRGAELLRLPDVPAEIETVPAELPGVEGERVLAAVGPLRAGDVLLDDEPSDDWMRLVTEPVAVLRGAEVIQIGVVPAVLKPDDDVGRIGVSISPPAVLATLTVPQAVVRGGEQTWLMLTGMLSALARMAVGQTELNLVGPLGISSISLEASEQGPEIFLGLMAALSVNLGLINLLPIPALDGGRLLFIAAEAVRGRRVEPAREAVVHLIGFVLVIGLMAVLTVFEAAKMVGGTGP
jgi:regulator of sigma E protease